jgi:hypothetical protein
MDSFGDRKVEERIAVPWILDGLVAILLRGSALSATGYGSVASPVISTLSLFSGGVANFIEFANGYCGNEPPFYVGVQYFVMPIHGC